MLDEATLGGGLRPDRATLDRHHGTGTMQNGFLNRLLARRCRMIHNQKANLLRKPRATGATTNYTPVRDCTHTEIMI